MELVERAAAQNVRDYVRAMQQVAPGLQSAAIPCAGGVAAFTGADSPLTTVKGAWPDITGDQIDETIAFFRQQGAQCVTFELAPSVSAETIDRLTHRGFKPADKENVVICDLPANTAVSALSVATMQPEPWTQLLIATSGLEDMPASHPILYASALLPHATNLGVRDATGRWIACAQIVPAAGIAIFGCDGTLPEARGQGAQTALIQERLRLARKLGVPTAIAEVAPGSTSERNYLRCGFRPLYTRTYYRLA